MEDDLISIIIPVYNVESYLPCCLDSVAGQTYTNFEAILVDDGSSDSSGAICDTYCTKDKRFKVIHQENQGLSGARNTGLSFVKGEYIYFIDSDDYIHPQIIETLYHAAISTGNKVSMVDGKVVSHSTSFEEVKIPIPQILNQETLIYRLFNKPEGDPLFKYSYVWNKLYHKSVVYDIYFNKLLCEDMDYNLRVYLRIDQLCYVDAQLYYYMRREDSLTNKTLNNTRSIDFIPEYLFFYQHIPSCYPLYQSYCIKRTIKMILSKRYDMKKTQLESYTAKKLKGTDKKAISYLWKIPNISIVEKMSMTIFMEFPSSYSLFRWWMETMAKMKKRIA